MFPKSQGLSFHGEITNSYCCVSAAFLRKLAAENAVTLRTVKQHTK